MRVRAAYGSVGNSPGDTAAQLCDADLERELNHSHEKRHGVFLDGTVDQLRNHSARTHELEQAYLERFADRVRDCEAKCALPVFRSQVSGYLPAMTQTHIDTAQDVVGFLKAQHGQIKSLFEDVIAKRGSEREQAFVELRRLLAVHETAEEEIVHPRAAREVAGGAAVVRARLHEEHEAKEMLAELEKLDIESTDFETRFRAFQQDVLAHAEAEEHEEFDKLRENLDDSQLERMTNAVRIAEAVAPTRPHAGVQSPAANMIAGPFAMMLDRARDAINGKG